MNRVEFIAKVSNGVVEIPQEYVHTMPVGRNVRVILLVDEDTNNDQKNGADHLASQSLEELVQEIKSLPSDPENFVPAGGRLAELLAETTTVSDFDEERWNREWAAVEAEMKANSLAHEQDELGNLSR